MSGALERIFIDGGAGRIETVIDRPGAVKRGVALVAHPHPLHGGTLDNKVVQTLAKTFVELGYGSGIFAPGLALPKARLYQVRHNAVLGHGLAVIGDGPGDAAGSRGIRRRSGARARRPC